MQGMRISYDSRVCATITARADDIPNQLNDAVLRQVLCRMVRQEAGRLAQDTMRFREVSRSDENTKHFRVHTR
jgi:hypothetical protein